MRANNETNETSSNKSLNREVLSSLVAFLASPAFWTALGLTVLALSL
jgi:hypothetical protein